ncbi:MAG: type I methionyl aminopeptidase [bacterium]|nr:type I methionyl aminopeptidase [bacterium]
MISLKTQDEIRIMSEGGKILAEVLAKLVDLVKPGMSEIELDGIAEKLILEKGAEPAFKRVTGYHHTLCVSTNDVVVHGIPSDYKFKEGDIIGIDCGVYYKGFNTDMAETIKIRNPKSEIRKDEIDRFLETGKRALEEAIKIAKIGNRIGDISKTIQDIVEPAGYSVVRTLVGHGVGKSLHEEPEVPGFLSGNKDQTLLLAEGLTIAIEVIYNMGKSEVTGVKENNWTIKTRDGSLSSTFEKTIAITKNGPLVITK